jgi:hypothetical protein
MSNNSPFVDDALPYPVFITSANLSTLASDIEYGSANFFRTSFNNNMVITVPLGADSTSVGIYTSNNIYLPSNIFNLVENITDGVLFINNVDATLLTPCTIFHDILIHYKITKADSTNYTNKRELRATIVQADGVTTYDDSIYSNKQPDTGDHDCLIMKGHVMHNQSDIVRIKFQLIQDITQTDETDSLLTIFRISWNLTKTN